MRGAVVAVACLLSVFASGCLTEKDDPKTDSTDAGTSASTSRSGTVTSTRTSTGSSTSSTGPTGNGTNQAPTANLTASPLNGTAPLTVTFTLNGTDLDGDALSWTLADGNGTLGNGTTLPATVSHNYTAAGNYTVTLTVSDGTLNATANVTVVVEAGAAGPAGPTEDDWVVFNADGTCDAKGEVGTLVYVHERGDPPGTGFVAGDGTWVYEESNGKSGLQVGGADDAAYAACLDPDTLIF